MIKQNNYKIQVLNMLLPLKIKIKINIKIISTSTHLVES